MPQQDPSNLATALYEYPLLYGCLSREEAWLTFSMPTGAIPPIWGYVNQVQ